MAVCEFGGLDVVERGLTCGGDRIDPSLYQPHVVIARGRDEELIRAAHVDVGDLDQANIVQL